MPAVAFGISDMAGPAACPTRSRMTQSGHYAVEHSWLRARGLKVVFFDQTVPNQRNRLRTLETASSLVTEKRLYTCRRLSSALVAMDPRNGTETGSSRSCPPRGRFTRSLHVGRAR